MLTLQQIIDHLSSAATSDLHKILNAVQNEIPKREGQSAEYVQYIEDFCEDTVLLENVQAECDQLDLSTKATNTATQWMSCSSKPYIYNDTNPVHKAKPMKDFPYLSKLLGLVNNSTEVTGPLDSCLVIKYNSDKASLRPHADDEPFIDQQKSICSFTLGSERTIEFWEKSKKPKLVKTQRMSNNGMVVMRPGTQQRLEHCVRAEPSTGPPDKTKVRYCLSFRAISKPDNDNSDDIKVQQSEPNTGETTTKRRVYLIAGDSFAARMEVKRLAKGKMEVESVAKGGAKISKVIKQLEDYKALNPEAEVLKMVVSVGTNDIRNCANGIKHLRGPFKALCHKIRELYPNSRIYFQSLLPLPLKGPNDWETNKMAMDFNRIIWNECTYGRFHYIDAFFPFIKFNRKHNEPYRRFDEFFENNGMGGIHPSPDRGMGVLARKYIRALHGNYFNPLVYQ